MKPQEGEDYWDWYTPVRKRPRTPLSDAICAAATAENKRRKKKRHAVQASRRANR